jgi:hypothetical protein
MADEPNDAERALDATRLEQPFRPGARTSVPIGESLLADHVIMRAGIVEGLPADGPRIGTVELDFKVGVDGHLRNVVRVMFLGTPAQLRAAAELYRDAFNAAADRLEEVHRDRPPAPD